MLYQIRPTQHFVKYHSDVDWEFVVRTILSPDKTRAEKIQNRFTYVKKFKKHVVEVHAEHSENEMIIWVINAFKMER